MRDFAKGMRTGEMRLRMGRGRIVGCFSSSGIRENDVGKMGHCFYVAVSCLGLGKLLLSERSLREISCRPNRLPELALIIILL